MNPREMHSKIDQTLQELEEKARRRRRQLATAGAAAGLLFNLNCGLPIGDLYGMAPAYAVDVTDAGISADAGVKYAVADAGEVDLGMQTLYGIPDAG